VALEEIRLVAYSSLFVGGWAVESGDWDFVEAEVDAELAAVVDEVVEEHGAIEDGSGALGDRLFAPAYLPVSLQVFVAGGLEGVAGFGAGFLEFGEELLSALEDHRGEFMVGEIEVVGGEDGSREFGEAGDVDGEAADGHGFVVRLPLRVVFGDAFEDAAGVLDFRVVIE
jgi:hypothetical protein